MRTADRYAELARQERIRGVWAQSRKELFSLAANGRLDPRTTTFRTFYYLHTLILRNPSALPVIARAMDGAVLNPLASESRGWIEEQRAWPLEMTQVLFRMQEGIQLLVNEYPRSKRLPSRTARLLPRYERLAGALKTCIAWVLPSILPWRTLWLAQMQLEEQIQLMIQQRLIPAARAT